jgi:hypothetical protein
MKITMFEDLLDEINIKRAGPEVGGFPHSKIIYKEKINSDGHKN